MYRPIEEAFDAGFLCFILGQDGEHRLHLLDTRLGNVKLTDMKAYPWLKPLGQEKTSKDSKQQAVVKDATQWVLQLLPKWILFTSKWGNCVFMLKPVSVLAEHWKTLLVTFQPLQPCKASNFTLKGTSARSNAA